MPPAVASAKRNHRKFSLSNTPNAHAATMPQRYRDDPVLTARSAKSSAVSFRIIINTTGP